MVKRGAVAGLFLSTAAVGAAYAAAFLPGGAPGWAAWLLALGIPGTLVSTLALGAARRGRLGRLVYPFALLFLLVAGGFCLLLALPAADSADPALWLGLPLRAAVVLYGVGLLPLFIVPVAYALTFEELTLSDEDLARVRELARERRAREDSPRVADVGARSGATGMAPAGPGETAPEGGASKRPRPGALDGGRPAPRSSDAPEPERPAGSDDTRDDESP